MTELLADYSEGIPADRSFESEWPELADRVRRSLAARGVPPWLRDDILQETGLRLFRMWDQVDAQRSPKGLALTIAHNLLWDEKHRKARGEVLGDLPDMAGEQDVERSGIARAELQAVWRALPRLNANHRSVLLAEIGGPAPAGSNGDALKMLRLRARRKLHAIIDNGSASVLVLGYELRRIAWRTTAAIRRNTIPAELPGSAVAALCCGAIAFLIVPFQVIPTPAAQAKDGVVTTFRPTAPLLRAVDEFTADSYVVANDSRFVPTRHATESRETPGQPNDDGTHLKVGGEDSPAGAEAGLEVMPRSDDEIKLPECGKPHVSDHGASVGCTITAPDREVRVKLKVGIRP